jgi:hypothetical protein
MKKFRWLQLITGIHRIHHIYYSYGWKIPFTRLGYFPDYKRKYQIHGVKTGIIPLVRGRVGKNFRSKLYHNCTLTGKY